MKTNNELTSKTKLVCIMQVGEIYTCNRKAMNRNWSNQKANP